MIGQFGSQSSRGTTPLFGLTRSVRRGYELGPLCAFWQRTNHIPSRSDDALAYCNWKITVRSGACARRSGSHVLTPSIWAFGRYGLPIGRNLVEVIKETDYFYLLR